MLPIAVGAIADSFGLSAAFVVPLAAYCFIAAFAAVARGERSIDAATASPIP
jgi:FHS family L-fucose permease-like MFS transporter